MIDRLLHEVPGSEATAGAAGAGAVPARCATPVRAACCAGGDLQLVSVPGYGIDTYLNLKRLEGEWQEAHVEESSSAVEAVRHA